MADPLPRWLTVAWIACRWSLALSPRERADVLSAAKATVRHLWTLRRRGTGGPGGPVVCAQATSKDGAYTCSVQWNLHTGVVLSGWCRLRSWAPTIPGPAVMLTADTSCPSKILEAFWAQTCALCSAALCECGCGSPEPCAL
jgi:hypothetical protein